MIAIERGPVGVIFDVDGVLVDSAEAHQKAWSQLGDEVGVPFSAERFRQTFGQRNASIIPEWLGSATAAQVDELGERKEVIYRDLVRRGAIRIFEGVPQIFGELRQRGSRIAVASSGPRANVELVVDLLGGAGQFGALISADDVQRGKPDPQAFLLAAARLAVDPRRCCVIEDSVHGIEAAKRADMLAVALLTSTTPAALEAAGSDWQRAEIAGLDIDELLSQLDQR